MLHPASYLGFGQGKAVARERQDLVILDLVDVVLSNAADICPLSDDHHVLAWIEGQDDTLQLISQMMKTQPQADHAIQCRHSPAKRRIKPTTP